MPPLRHRGATEEQCPSVVDRTGGRVGGDLVAVQVVHYQESEPAKVHWMETLVPRASGSRARAVESERHRFAVDDRRAVQHAKLPAAQNELAHSPILRLFGGSVTPRDRNRGPAQDAPFCFPVFERSPTAVSI